MASRVFSRATASNAKRFFQAVIEAMPFAVRSIQVDGGSEFQADFERANRSARIEFWSLYDGPLTVADIAPRLAEHQFFHNYRRPH